MSGVDLDGRRSARARPTPSALRRGERRRPRPRRGPRIVDEVAQGATPLVVAEGARVLGVVQLKDIVKGGIASASPSCGAWASAP
jgi:K+-transporting ATPase ATPase B chain